MYTIIYKYIYRALNNNYVYLIVIRYTKIKNKTYAYIFTDTDRNKEA